MMYRVVRNATFWDKFISYIVKDLKKQHVL